MLNGHGHGVEKKAANRDKIHHSPLWTGFGIKMMLIIIMMMMMMMLMMMMMMMI